MDQGSPSQCKFWLTCFWNGFLETIAWTTSSDTDPASDMTAQWAIIAGASSEYAYRKQMGKDAIDDLTNTHETKVLAAIEKLIRVHLMTIKSIESHLNSHKYLTHMYAVPVREGYVAKMPGSEFLKKYAIHIFFGTKPEFSAFIGQEKEDEQETQLRNAGFEVKN